MSNILPIFDFEDMDSPVELFPHDLGDLNNELGVDITNKSAVSFTIGRAAAHAGVDVVPSGVDGSDYQRGYSYALWEQIVKRIML